jgi:predicted nucleotidyltransferase component of viral defense system
MENTSKPDSGIAKQVLPAPLYQALSYIFEQNITGCVLVGGTALSGFYAGHRRSDDLDLFVKDDIAFSQTLLAVKSLSNIGTQIKDIAHSNQYYKTLCNLNSHDFTVDIVQDVNLFKVGTFYKSDAITVADLPTLFMMKSAALLSRCSEKDLYDLEWLLENIKGASILDIIQNGVKIDSGMKAETVLYSISSSQTRKEGCGFSLDPAKDSKAIFDGLIKFKKRLIKELTNTLQKNTDSDLKPIIDTLRELK